MPRPAVPRPLGQPDPLVALADRCVQCGLCLPACPTYAHDRLEAESPRGRIALARGLALGAIQSTPVGDAHLDHCLGCRSCEAVCPAGVDYGGLLRLARERQRGRRRAPWRLWMAESMVSRPRLLNVLLGAYRRIFPLLPSRSTLLPRPPEPTRLRENPCAQAALFVGCVAGSFEQPLRAALSRLAAATGADLAIPAGQTCCGSLHAHAGNTRQSDALATRNRKAFEGRATVLTLASGCHENVASALAGDVSVIDALAWLAKRAESLRFMPRRERVAVHLPCTQRNVVRSVSALRELLARVPGLEIVELTAGSGCCGAAGAHMLLEPQRAADYRRPLLEQLEASGATRLLSANLGCRLHFANGTSLPVQHPLEFLDDCLARAAGEFGRPESTVPGTGAAVN